MKRKSSKEGFVLKVGLEKTYYRMDWDYLHEMLKYWGFGEIFWKLIMNTIFSTTLSVCCNSITLEHFTPSQGLKQRDSLIPYLFTCLYFVWEFWGNYSQGCGGKLLGTTGINSLKSEDLASLLCRLFVVVWRSILLACPKNRKCTYQFLWYFPAVSQLF